MDTKGKNTFTTEEIALIKKYIQERVKAEPSAQKGIRAKMREIGFYGSDYGIHDCQVSDLEGLIRSGRIKVIGGKPVSAKAPSATPLPAVPTKAAKPAACATTPVKGLAAAEKRLIQGDFVSVGALSGEMVPDVPGLYSSQGGQAACDIWEGPGGWDYLYRPGIYFTETEVLETGTESYWCCYILPKHRRHAGVYASEGFAGWKEEPKQFQV